jgi:ABC-2 type transport system permease protein
MFSQTLTIARNTFLESVRQPIYFILTVICGLAVLFTFWTAAFSMDYSSSAEVSADDKVAVDICLATVFVCATLMAAFLATAVISKEIDRKTVLTVVSKPVARPTVVFGKYLGVAGAILIATVTMLLFVQMGIRHKVMSTAADELDGPVLLFTFGAVLLSGAIGIWCNFFYGWSFTQACTMLMCPFMIVAWVGVLLVNKKWGIQPILTDFKPEISKASVCLLFAVLVLTSIATACSARLGQVMTLVVCAGAFVLGLMSNHFIGSRAIDNTFVAQIDKAEPRADGMKSFLHPEDTYDCVLYLDPRVRMAPGSPVYYGEFPSGYALAVQAFTPFAGDVNSPTAITDRTKPPAIAVVSQQARKLTIVRTGAEGDLVARPPQAGDYLFTRLTKYNPIAFACWSVVPNVQFFWLLDAVSQAQPIPVDHVVLVGLYALAQVGVFLCLAVMLFQTREVG